MHRIGRFFLLLVVCFFLCSSCQEKSGQTLRFFAGTYSSADEPGIYSCEVDLDTKQVRVRNVVRGIENPSFLALSPNRQFLYAVSETDQFDSLGSGGVYSFRINPKNLALTEINAISSGGAHPCHLSVHPTGRFLYVANYTGGNIASISLYPDGGLKERLQTIPHRGSGLLSGRQDSPHAHSVTLSGSGDFLLAADLGIDRVLGYRISLETGDLRSIDQGSVRMTPGAGPRHMAFHPGDSLVYVINELNSTITSAVFDEETGRLDTLHSVTTLPGRFTGENFGADIHVHPSGKYLYASNRGHQSIAVFSLKDGGLPKMIQTHSSIGEWPRNFAISPDGKYLMVANQHSGNIVLMEIDATTGLLHDMGIMAMIPHPVCLLFYIRSNRSTY